MAEFQIRSVAAPFDDPEIARKAAAAFSLADAMGILSPDERIERLDRDTFRSVAHKIAEAGIARAAIAEMGAQTKPAAFGAIIDRVVRAMEESPLPERELPALVSLLGADTVADLIRVSRSSVVRYAAGRRETPGDVADRLHFIALLVGDLAGTYNAEGIRRWFLRPRAQLDGKSPNVILGPSWSPDTDGARRVRALARSLMGSPAT